MIRQEEQTFFATIDAGLARVEAIFAAMARDGRVVVHGEDAAELYSTYGIPPELVESLAAERNLTFDTEGFRQAMVQHGIDSGKQQIELFKTGPVEALKKALHVTHFVGYETEQANARHQGIIAQKQLCDQVTEVGHEQPVTVVLDQTPFYAESGGQVGDTGELSGDGFTFLVADTQKDGDLILHRGHLRGGVMRAGAHVTARVDGARRGAIRRAHSSTHLLHYALQKNLGRHAQQQGSKVDEDWFRFDFTHLHPVSDEELSRIEQDVIERIGGGEPVRWDFVPLAEAREKGAMMLFGEKYPDPVRLVTMGDFSRELCGGTHVSNTREVSHFEIVSEESVSTGTRRIVALTGAKAADHARQTGATLRRTADLCGVLPLEVPAAIRTLMHQIRDLRKQLTSGTLRGQPSFRSLAPLGGLGRTDLRARTPVPARGGSIAQRRHTRRAPAGRGDAGGTRRAPIPSRKARRKRTPLRRCADRAR